MHYTLNGLDATLDQVLNALPLGHEDLGRDDQLGNRTLKKAANGVTSAVRFCAAFGVTVHKD